MEKEGCQRITQKSCNLTMETGNLTELYYARVTATDGAGRSATKMTDRFNSLQHSEWGDFHCTGSGVWGWPFPLWSGCSIQRGSASQGQLRMWLLRKTPQTGQHPPCGSPSFSISRPLVCRPHSPYHFSANQGLLTPSPYSLFDSFPILSHGFSFNITS